jgi:hypothetical protein
VPPTTPSFLLRWRPINFCPGWPGTAVLPIPTFLSSWDSRCEPPYPKACRFNPSPTLPGKALRYQDIVHCVRQNVVVPFLEPRKMPKTGIFVWCEVMGSGISLCKKSFFVQF